MLPPAVWEGRRDSIAVPRPQPQGCHLFASEARKAEPPAPFLPPPPRTLESAAGLAPTYPEGRRPCTPVPSLCTDALARAQAAGSRQVPDTPLPPSPLGNGNRPSGNVAGKRSPRAAGPRTFPWEQVGGRGLAGCAGRAGRRAAGRAALLPAVEFFRVLLSHHVESVCDGSILKAGEKAGCLVSG